MTSGRVLAVLVHRAMGDSIMTLPLLRACQRATRPDDRVIFVVRSPFVEEFLNALPWNQHVEISAVFN